MLKGKATDRCTRKIVKNKGDKPETERTIETKTRAVKRERENKRERQKRKYRGG